MCLKDLAIADDEIEFLVDKWPFHTKRSVFWMCARDIIHTELLGEHRNVVVKNSRPRRIQEDFMTSFVWRQGDTDRLCCGIVL